MYYNNNNKTLPLGMHVTDGIIINTKDLKLKQKEKLQNYIIKSSTISIDYELVVRCFTIIKPLLCIS